jgi:prophage DNA circulation protein
MAWRDDLLTASWRGVPFFVTAAKTSLGRRADVHEYPAREDAYVEDLGRLARRYVIDGFVIGPDYLTQRQDLEAALEEVGPGELVHPYCGTITAQLVGEATITESDSEGGLARVSMTFAPAGAARSLTVLVEENTAAALEEIADALDAAMVEDASAVMAILTEALRVYEAIVSAIDSVSFALMSAIGTVRGMIARVETVVATVGRLSDQIAELAALPGDLIGAVQDAIDDVMSAVGAIGEALADALGTSDDARASVRETLPAAASPLDDVSRADALVTVDRRLAAVLASWAPVTGTTVTRTAMRANQEALRRGILAARASSLVRAVAGGLQIADVAQADALRARVLEILSELQAETGLSDEASALVLDMRRAWIAAMRDVTSDAPSVRVVTPRVTVPSLLVAYEELGDAGRDLEVCRRNDIPHPGFVQGAAPVEIVDD